MTMRPIPTLDEAEVIVMKAVRNWKPVVPPDLRPHVGLSGADADGLSLPKAIARALFIRVAESVPNGDEWRIEILRSPECGKHDLQRDCREMTRP